MKPYALNIMQPRTPKTVFYENCCVFNILRLTGDDVATSHLQKQGNSKGQGHGSLGRGPKVEPTPLKGTSILKFIHVLVPENA